MGDTISINMYNVTRIGEFMYRSTSTKSQLIAIAIVNATPKLPKHGVLWPWVVMAAMVALGYFLRGMV